ncbi:MAG: GerAB/ArcD/ProY family transporter [Clostridia bacterium]|nr:GerAB/ArcD/ProY family transporter [Clostridia bacterium]
MSRTKIGTTEAILIILTVVFSHSILTLPRTLVTNTKSSVLLNIAYITIISVLTSLLIYRLIKKFGSFDIVDISEYLGGSVLKNIIGWIFIFHFIVSASMLLRNFCECLALVYFQMTDVIFIILIFIIGMCISNNFGFNVTLKSNMLILPVAIVSIIFIFVANFNNFDPQKIFPILGNGVYNTFVSGLINLASFGGIIFLYFIPPYLKEPDKYKKICIISMVSTGIFLTLCVSVILFIFPAFFNTNEIMPLYSAARYISFGNFLQRLDSIIMLIWITAFLSYLSIACKFSVNIFQKLTKIKDSKPIINIFGLLILAISLIPKNLAVSTFFESTIYNYITLGIVFALGIGILILANLKKKRII